METTIFVTGVNAWVIAENYKKGRFEYVHNGLPYLIINLESDAFSGVVGDYTVEITIKGVGNDD